MICSDACTYGGGRWWEIACLQLLGEHDELLVLGLALALQHRKLLVAGAERALPRRELILDHAERLAQHRDLLVLGAHLCMGGGGCMR